MAIYTDDFTASSTTSLENYSADWAQSSSNSGYVEVNATTDRVGVPGTAYDWNIIVAWVTGTFSNDQYAQAVQKTFSGNNIGPAVRTSATQVTGHFFYSEGTNYAYFGRYINDAWTGYYDGSTTSGADDVFYIEANGDDITCLINGSAPASWGSNNTQVDSYIDTGRPGVAGWDGNYSLCSMDDWEGGDLFGSFRQSKGNQNDSASSVTTTFDNTPVEGSLLVAAYFTGAASGGVTSSGWTKAFDITDTPNADQGNLWYKIAGASESTSVVAEPVAANENMLVIYEFAGPWGDVAVTLTDSQAAATDDTIELGGTTKSPNELAFAMTTARWDQSGIVSTTDGFVNGQQSATSFKILDTAYRFIATKGTTIATTLTLNGTGYVTMGGLASFTEQETRTSQAFAEVGWQIVNPEIYISQAFVEVGYTISTETPANTSTPAYLVGSADDLDNQIAYLFGNVFISDSTEAFTTADVYEILDPDADVTDGDWIDNLGGSDLATAVADDSDATYVYQLDPELNEYFEVALENPTDGSAHDGRHIITVRASDFISSGTMEIQIQLRQGTDTVIATRNQVLTDSWQTYSYELSQGEIDTITDYDDLRVRIIIVDMS